MKKNRESKYAHKFVAIVLSLIMITGSFSAIVFAEEVPTDKTAKQSSSVKDDRQQASPEKQQVKASSEDNQKKKESTEGTQKKSESSDEKKDKPDTDKKEDKADQKDSDTKSDSKDNKDNKSEEKKTSDKDESKDISQESNSNPSDNSAKDTETGTDKKAEDGKDAESGSDADVSEEPVTENNDPVPEGPETSANTDTGSDAAAQPVPAATEQAAKVKTDVPAVKEPQKDSAKVTEKKSVSPKAAKLAYYLDYSSSEGGTISVKIDGSDVSSHTPIMEGVTVTLSSQAISGYKLKGITMSTDDGKTTAVSDSFSMPASNVKLVATFEKKGGTLNLNSSEGGSVTITVDGSNVASGTFIEEGKTVTLTASPASSYVLKDFTATPGVTDLSKSGNTAAFTMPDSNVTAGASFKVNGCHLILKSTEGGTLTATVESGSEIAGHPSYYTYKSRIRVTAVPNDGYIFKQATLSDSNNTKYAPTDYASYVYRLDTDEFTINAEFVKGGNADNMYNINLNVGNGGKIKVTTPDKTVYKSTKAKVGQEITVECIADDGYVYFSGSFDGVMPTRTKSGTYVFTMVAKDVDISASFVKKVTPDIRIIGGHATATLDKDCYGPRETVKVTAKADKGYYIKSVNYIYNKKTGGTATNEGNGVYSFTLQNSEVLITVVVKADSSSGGSTTSKSSSRSSSRSSSAPSSGSPSYSYSYSSAGPEAATEAAAEPEKEEEEEEVTEIDVTPLAARIVAETVMTVTASVLNLTIQ